MGIKEAIEAADEAIPPRVRAMYDLLRLYDSAGADDRRGMFVELLGQLIDAYTKAEEASNGTT